MNFKGKKLDFRYALAFIIIFTVEVFIAVFVRDNFIRPYMGDVLVVILIYCFLRIFIMRPIKLIPMYIFIFAAGVEIAQYFDFVKVLGLQNNTVVAIILGSVFDIKDILCYLAGCTLLFVYQELTNKYYFKHIHL